FFFFFFSSRRRHTRFSRDWSSDVCSSDLKEYPDYYRFYSIREFTWNKITQPNRNPLLGMDIGADGMKTGYTDASGYAIVGSVERDGHRVFAAMSGMQSEQERAEESRKLLEWGLRAFEKTALFNADEIIGEAQVFGGAK